MFYEFEPFLNEVAKDTNKYVLNFTESAEKIKKVGLGKLSVKAPQSPRYSSRERILSANSLDGVF